MGLMIEARTSGEVANLSITGLERITSFIHDTGVLGKDLSSLKGKNVSSYVAGGIHLIGIGVEQ